MGPTWIVIVMAMSEKAPIHAAVTREFTDEAEARTYFETQCKELPSMRVHLATARATRMEPR